MPHQKIFQIDAFADKLFRGNPAAVCVLDKWLDDSIMQNIAMENNLAETAFTIGKENYHEIRWFTPTVEVELCGHATLAASYVLFNFYNAPGNTIKFQSRFSGELKVEKKEEKLFLDFPADELSESDNYQQVKLGIGVSPKELYKGKTDFLAVINSEEELINLDVNISEINKLDARGLIVTAKSNKYDFVSRFFAPQCGVDEDPVTGSAHTSLIPYWAKHLGKSSMTAKQISKRGGVLDCSFNGSRVSIGGEAKLYLKGEIFIV